jgi:plasmid rolling circle replication initiator protein Rep
LYKDYNINEKEMEVLKDITKSGKERPWREKKLKTIELAESYRRLGNKKYYRIKECGTYLEYKRFLETLDFRLNRANFCKVRLCPMCSWRRSLKIFGQTSKIMNTALEEKEYRFLFLTLTCKNVNGEDLSNQIDELFKAFTKTTRRKQFKQSVKGWFRALEVTHNLDKSSVNYDTYHPHFHMVLMVNESYFKDTRIYLTHKDWVELWKSCMSIDYEPFINIKAFKSGTKEETEKSVAEVAKYAVKDDDLIIKDESGQVDEELTDDAVFILDKALANRRLTAFGGKLREIQQELKLDDLEKGDLVLTDNEDEELREDLEYLIESYYWKVGYNQYIKL